MKRKAVFLCFLLCAAVAALAADPYAARRQTMVEHDLKGRGITDQKVLAAMAQVPRHLFVADSFRDQAYGDHPLPIAEGQTISQPYVVALMTEAVRLKPTDRVLEIGKRLADTAAERLKSLGYRNVAVKFGDGYFGWEEHAPYDAIIITAAANHIPPPLIRQ